MSITIKKGKGLSIALSVERASGEAYPLTDCELEFTVKKVESETEARIKKTTPKANGIEITDEAGGKATITIDGADTEDFISGTYVCGIELTEADEEGQEIYKDFFFVLEPVS